MHEPKGAEVSSSQSKRSDQRVSVIGLGYVGLPLALLCARRGFRALGVDISVERVNAIRDRLVTIDDVYAAPLLNETTLQVSGQLTSSDIYVVCVPTPVDERNEPDLKPVMDALAMINEVCRDGDLVVIESTIYPGMCEEVILPALLRSGRQVELAHCPERINPGDRKWSVNNIPRVVGGGTPEATRRAYAFYSQLIEADVVQLESIKSAEATKILENTFRDVNIALVNEMAQAFYRMGINTPEVIRAATSKPFGFMPHWPGVGVGGHCIAVDPYYMIEKGRQAGFDHEFLKLARKINSNMPIYTVQLVQNSLNALGMAVKGTRVGVYGLSYKANVGDTRESPSYEVIRRLKGDKLADVKAFDPYLPQSSDFGSLDEMLRNVDVVIVCTAHDEISCVDFEHYRNLALIVDGRNCLDRNRIVAAGIMYRGIGNK
jgi:UDP-N-acetyl-D-glucosamine dehydrogenase